MSAANAGWLEKMDAANAAAKSVGRINSSQISLKQSSKRFLLTVFVDVTSALCMHRLGGSSGGGKDADLERADVGGVNAWQSTIDDETTADTTAQTTNGRGVIIVLAVWRSLC